MKPSKEILESLYIRDKVSPRKIGIMFGHHERTIRGWMEDYGIPRGGCGHLRRGIPATWNKGRIVSIETRRRMSLSQVGRSAWNIGIGSVNFTCEVCGKPVFDKPYRRKRTCSKACKNKLLTSLRGKDHWNFRPTIPATIQRQRFWIESREWQRLVLKKDNYTCRKCLKPGGKLTGHHLNNWANHPEQRFDPDNGACLCFDCHWDFHRKYGLRFCTSDMFYDWIKKFPTPSLGAMADGSLVPKMPSPRTDI